MQRALQLTTTIEHQPLQKLPSTLRAVYVRCATADDLRDTFSQSWMPYCAWIYPRHCDTLMTVSTSRLLLAAGSCLA